VTGGNAFARDQDRLRRNEPETCYLLGWTGDLVLVSLHRSTLNAAVLLAAMTVCNGNGSGIEVADPRHCMNNLFGFAQSPFRYHKGEKMQVS
jgi:hypothetical protein